MTPPLEIPNGAYTPEKASPSNEEDDSSIDSNYDPETPTIATTDSTKPLQAPEELKYKYDAATIRAEFKTYQAILPHPDALLQEQHSFQTLRTMIEHHRQGDRTIELPRFLKYKFEGGIKPHNALCCLLLSEYEKAGEHPKQNPEGCVYPCLVRALSFGYLHSQLNTPAEFIRDQFNRVAHVIPIEAVKPKLLRTKIRNRGLPVPNYFLDPEDGKQFPPHIALLVILQDGEKESEKLDNLVYRVLFNLFAFVALLLRIVLEVIGGAGAIWGGAEVFTLRNADNADLWRGISGFVGVLCVLRFLTLNAPQKEDEGDILGPAGPWSLRPPVRLRAVCEHPFHYFVRAVPPFSHSHKKCE